MNTDQAFGGGQEEVAISGGSGIAITVLRSLYLSEIRLTCLQMKACEVWDLLQNPQNWVEEAE